VEKILQNKSPWTQTHLLDTAPGRVQIGSTSSGGGDVTTKVIINWFARPLREATARYQMLENPKVTKAQLDGILNRSLKFIEVMVTDLPLGRGGRGARGGGGDADEEITKFKEATFLQTKAGQRIPLANMIMPRGRGQALTLQFAREVDGKPTVTAEDQEITLSIRIGEKTYKFKFKLAEMMVSDKLEI
jgi:hypothetical protein